MMMNYYRMLWSEEEYNKIYQIDFVSQNDIAEQLAEEISRHGCRYYKLPSRKKQTFSHYKELRRVVRQGHYDIVHLNCNSATGAFDLLTIGNLVKKRIAHVHNSSTQYPVLHRIMKPIFNCLYTDAVACSQIAGDWIFNKDFVVLNNAIDMDRFQFNEEIRRKMRVKYGIADADYVVGHVGKMFTDQKNQEYLISIFPEIKKAIPQAVLFFVGDGKYMETHKKEAADTGLEKDIIFAGFHSNINEYMQMFDVFCFPSRYEGLSLAAVEAQASGLCVVMSDRISKETAVTSNASFVGIEKENSSDWVKEILKYKSNDLNRVKRCETARKEMEMKGYDIHKELNKLIEIYE